MKTIAALLLSIRFAGPAAAATDQAPIPTQTPATAVEIHDDARHARALYDAGEYARAGSELEALVAQVPDHGELWYLLGQSRDRLGDGPGAITAYRRSLEAGYRYSGSVTYRIAQLYAGTGDRERALDWLELALERRWEDRPGVAQDDAFDALSGEPRFNRLTGVPRNDGERSREARWRYDIDYLVKEARRLHAGPDRPAFSEGFQAAAASLKGLVTEYSDDRMVLEIGRLLTLLGDGHTGLLGVDPGTPLALRNGTLPVSFYQFADGLFVRDAVEAHQEWVGWEVVRFGDRPTTAVLDTLRAYMPADNGMTVKWLGIHHILPSLTFLEAIGATADPSRASLTLRGPGGQERRVVLEGGPHLPTFQRKLQPPPNAPAPLFLSNVEDPYWLRVLPDRDAVYVQFNQVRDAEDGTTIAAFADTLRVTLERTGARHLVVDVRHNNGGNNGLLRPLVRALVWWELDDPAHKIFVVTSRNTFSAAQNFISRVERWTDATFVGEPSSSSPNFTGETTNLVLPYSKVRGSISTRTWQESDPDDVRPYIVPDAPIALYSADYFAGRDPVLETVFRLMER